MLSECHYAECRDYLNVMLSVVRLNVIMLIVVRLNVIMLSVVAPKKWFLTMKNATLSVNDSPHSLSLC